MTSDKTPVMAVAHAVHRARRIVVITGAGISVSAGIPDFRSQDGLYSLVKDKYPDSVVKGQDLFDARLFTDAKATKVFYTFMANLKVETDKATATTTHRFIKLLADSGKLLRCYTQNIDGLEGKAGLRMESHDPAADDSSTDKEADARESRPATGVAKANNKKNPFREHHVVQLHGTVAHVHCIVCRAQFRFTDTYIKQFSTGTPPECPACIETDNIRTKLNKRSLAIGTLRPSIILYNEVHPQGDLIAECAASDAQRRPDMLIVMGTSLKVPGIRRMVKDMAKTVKAHKSGMCVLLNKTPLSSVREWQDAFDVILEEECDKVTQKWEEELAKQAKIKAERKEKRDKAKAERERKTAECTKGQTTLPFPVVKSPAKAGKQLHFSLDEQQASPVDEHVVAIDEAGADRQRLLAPLVTNGDDGRRGNDRRRWHRFREDQPASPSSPISSFGYRLCHRRSTRIWLVVSVAVAAAITLLSGGGPDNACRMQPPVAARKPLTRSIHGDTTTDYYAWLRHADNDTEAAAYIQAENDYFVCATLHLASTQQQLKQELTHAEAQVTPLNDFPSSFQEFGDYLYFQVSPANTSLADYPLYYRLRTGANTTQGAELAFNAAILYSADVDSFAMGYIEPSPSHTMLAYAYDTLGDERFTIRFHNITSQTPLCEGLSIPRRGYYSLRWMDGDDLWVVYNVVDDLGVPRGAERFSLRWCSDEAKMRQFRQAGRLSGEQVYWEDDPTLTMDVRNTNDHAFVVLMSAGQVTSRPLLVVRDDQTQLPVAQPLFPIRPNIMADVEHNRGFMYLRINADNSPNFKIVRMSVNQTLGVLKRSPPHFVLDTSREQTIIEHSSIRYIEKMEMFDQYLVVWFWDAGARSFMAVELTDLHAQSGSAFSLDAATYTLPVARGTPVAVMPGTVSDLEERLPRNFLSTRLIFSNASFTQPMQTYSMSLRNPADVYLVAGSTFSTTIDTHRSVRLWVSRSHFYIEPPVQRTEDLPRALLDKLAQDARLAERATDPLIPVDVLYRSTTSDSLTLLEQIGGSPRRVLAEAYGAYGGFLSPVFSPLLVPVVDRDILVVRIHPRGDGDMGRWWYNSGRTVHKPNTFRDVQTALQALIREKITRPASIALLARSAGGLVAGVTANSFVGLGTGDQSLVKFVIAQVPFVDAVTDMMDPTVPWTQYEWVEWGNPLNETEYRTITQYSPYDNVHRGPSPDILVTAGREDSRVPFYEPLKWTANMRHHAGRQTDHILMHMYSGGHFSGKDAAGVATWLSLMLEKLAQ
ncbi:ribosylnicotinamide kinase [Sorochytrium milnesiophthora]